MMFINRSGFHGSLRQASAGMRVTCAMVGGAAAGAIASLFMLATGSILVGWDVAVVIYLVWVWSAVWRLDPYFAFTVGMTFQVADTNITSKAIRRVTLHHALPSYLFGAVLLGLVINVVATLLG
jgi:uncharacterized membrane protein